MPRAVVACSWPSEPHTISTSCCSGRASRCRVCPQPAAPLVASVSCPGSDPPRPRSARSRGSPERASPNSRGSECSVSPAIPPLSRVPWFRQPSTGSPQQRAKACSSECERTSPQWSARPPCRNTTSTCGPSPPGSRHSSTAPVLFRRRHRSTRRSRMSSGFPAAPTAGCSSRSTARVWPSATTWVSPSPGSPAWRWRSRPPCSRRRWCRAI